MSLLTSVMTQCQAAELAQESLLSRYAEIAPLKLRWRSSCIKHFLHVVPGERLLLLGAGSGLWAAQLSNALSYENQIVAAVFTPSLLSKAPPIECVTFVSAETLEDFAPEHFDYVVSSTLDQSIISPELLALVNRVLKPGGQVFFFEPNTEKPWRKIAKTRRSRAVALELLSAAGFQAPVASPYDIVPWAFSRRAAKRIQAKAILLEHAPGLREFAGAQYVTGRKPGDLAGRFDHSLADHASLRGSVSVVIPCYNEAPNIPALTEQLIAFYGPYLHEILLVNDNSRDNTVEVVSALTRRDKRIKLVNRTKPNGVGLALRDGYRAAAGRYILSMDCDFVTILPELRGLFDAVAEGYDGAIGSRFSHDSIVLNYPFSKMVCNRMFHLLIRLFVKSGVRDVTNNLKLYRADILKTLPIKSAHFSANLETGLKPLLEGYKIREVAISWIDRSAEMGTSSFNLQKVGGDYIRAFVDIWKSYRIGNRPVKSAHQEAAASTTPELESSYKR